MLWWWVAQGWLSAAGAPTISVLPHCWPWAPLRPVLSAQGRCSLAPARFHEVWRTVFNGPSFKPPKVFRCPWWSRSPWPQNLLPCGKYSPNTPQPLPLHPFLCYLFGFALLRFSACLRTQPELGLLVNKLSINVGGWGKIVSFAHRLLGPGRWPEVGNSSVPGAWPDVWGRRRAARSHEEGAAKGFRVCLEELPPRDGRFPTAWVWGCRDVLLCKPLARPLGWIETDAHPEQLCRE